jgi:hypothetical protein
MSHDTPEAIAITDKAARELIAFEKKLAAPKWYDKAPVNTALAVGLIAVIMIISMEKMHESDLVQVHQDGFAAGYSLGQSDIGETMAKRVTDKTCMSWWYSGSSTKMCQAIKKVKGECV